MLLSITQELSLVDKGNVTAAVKARSSETNGREKAQVYRRGKKSEDDVGIISYTEGVKKKEWRGGKRSGSGQRDFTLWRRKREKRK